jgi:hypothetical protein
MHEQSGTSPVFIGENFVASGPAPANPFFSLG